MTLVIDTYAGGWNFQGIHHLLMLFASIEVDGWHRLDLVEVYLVLGRYAGTGRHLRINIERPSPATEELCQPGHC